MKRLFIIISLLQICLFSQAQTVSHDTIYNRHSRYLFTDWYDECPNFERGGLFKFLEKASPQSFAHRFIWSFYQYTDHPIEIYGLSCLVSKQSWTSVAYSHDTLPEYLYLFQKKTPDSLYYDLTLLDSVRWDTANYKILRVPASIDSNTDGMLECYVYEAYFKSPIVVDSVFYIGGTHNNSLQDIHPETGNYAYFNPKTVYAYMWGGFRDGNGEMNGCYTPHCLRYHWGGAPYLQSQDMLTHDRNEYSPFFPIINSRRILVLSADSTMGIGYPSGNQPIGPGLVIYAEANEGYRFSHWNDGDTNNPRVITLLQDTIFTAYFEDLDLFSVSATVNNEDWGEVYGAGSYYDGSEAILTVSPNYGYRFESWTDGDTLNPRNIMVTSDTSFTAILQPEQVGIDEIVHPTLTLTPNPTNGRVILSCSLPMDRILVFASNGKRMLKLRHCQKEKVIDLSSLSPGSYIVEVRTIAGTITRKLIVGR